MNARNAMHAIDRSTTAAMKQDGRPETVGTTRSMTRPTTGPTTRQTGRDEPLGHYAVLIGTFASFVTGSVYWLGRKKRLPASVAPLDLALLGLATTRVSRFVTRDQAARVVRAPFTATGPDAHEEPRRVGGLRAMGELVTCPRCVGIWASGALTVAFMAAPKATRLLCTILASAAISDQANATYAFTQRA